MAKQRTLFDCFGGDQAGPSNAASANNKKREADKLYDKTKRTRSYDAKWENKYP